MENKISAKKIVSLVAIALSFIAIILFILLPAIKIGPSFAFNEQVNAGKEAFVENQNWTFTVQGFQALFGGSDYEVIRCGVGAQAYNIRFETETTSFNVAMLAGIILAVAASVLYGVMIIKKIKNPTLNKVVVILYIAAALMVLLTAVWFYAFNPIEESNYYDSTTKLDTTYKFCSAGLASGPVISSVLLVGSGICAVSGEF